MEQLRTDRTIALLALRENLESSGGHWRSSDIAAQLAWAWTTFLDFAENLGAINADERQTLDTRVENALEQGKSTGRNCQGEDDPAHRFVELIQAALMSGDAHLTDMNGNCPAGEWGWRLIGQADKQYFAPLGACIGWTEGDDVYLNADSAYRTAGRMASNGNGVDVGAKTLHKRLADAGLLKTRDDARGTHTVRKAYGGGRPEFLHLARATLAPPDDDASESSSDHHAGDEALEI